jgi:hypothetical protein
MSKFVGFIAGAALIATGFVLLPAGVGLFAATAVARTSLMLVIEGGLLILSQAAFDLTAPKIPARDAAEMTLQLGEQPRVMLVGETFTPGSLVDGFDYGGKYGTDWEVLIIRLADEPCEGLTGFYVNDEYVPYTGDGNYPQFDSHHFQLYFRANTSVDPLPDIVLDNGPGWTSDDIGQSGCDVIVAYLADAPDAKHPAWPGGRPHFGFVVKGGKRYDPRLDDTVTGGSGPHRIDDPTTWEWTANAVINWYAFERGVYVDGDTTDQSKLLVGRGLSAEESPPENIFAAANLCDDIAAAAFPVQSLTPASSLAGSAYSPDYTKLVVISGTTYYVWYVPTRTLIATDTTTNFGTAHPAVNDDGSFYASSGSASGTYHVFPGGGADKISSTTVSGGLWNITAGLWGRHSIPTSEMLEFDGTTFVGTSIGFSPDWYFNDLDGVNLAVGGKQSGGSYVSGFGFYNIDASAQHLVTATSTGSARAIDNGNGQYFVHHGSSLYLIDKSTFAITAGPVSAVASSTDNWFVPLRNGDKSVWIDWTRYSTQDLSVVETINPDDWVTAGSGSGAIYDPINDAIWNHDTLDTVITVRFLHRHGGYRVAGPIYSTQEFIDVEGMFAAAVGGNIVTFEGQVLLEPGQAKSVVATITDDDLLVGSEVNWNQGFLSESDGEWVNTVVANYIEPDQKWNAHNTPPLRDTADIVADGKPREATITLRLVRYSAQAMRVAEINRRLGRLWGRATIKLGPRFCELEAGDWISWTSDRYLAGGTKTLRIDANNIDEKWQNALTLREIDGSVYADDATFPTDQSTATFTPPPPDTSTPTSGTWTLAAVTLDSAGASVPALELTGVATDDDGSVESVIVEYWLSDGVTDPTVDPDSIAWTMVGTYPPSTTKIDITGLTGAGTYYVALTYIVSGIPGDRLVLGPVTIADLEVTASITYASAAEIRAGAVANKAIAPDQLELAVAPQTLTDGATTNWDMSLAINAAWTIGGARTLAVSNPVVGMTYVLAITQDATGSRTVTWPASFNWGFAGTPTLSTAAGKTDIVSIYCRDAATPKFRAVFNKDA